MPNKLRVALFSPYLPSLDSAAFPRKVYDYIRLLSCRGHLIYLFSFCSQDDREKIDKISPFCKSLKLEFLKDYSRYPHTCRAFKQEIASLCKNEDIDIIQCEQSYMNRYIPKYIRAPRILVEHEILSESFLQKAVLKNNFFHKIILYSRSIKKYLEEKRWYAKFNAIVVFSNQDRNIIRTRYGRENIKIIPLGIDLNAYQTKHITNTRYDLLCVGNFLHSPNVDAILYFCKKILPLVKKNLPSVSLVITGCNPAESIIRLAKENTNITVSGYIENLAGTYSEAKIFIAPIRYGTGMRYKIIEAMALGVPVVSTSVGARGFHPDELKIADNPKEFANAVVELLKNPDECNRMAKKGRAAVEQYYSWDKLLDQYEAIYDDLAMKPK
ncbi:MAG: glycosyltransferase family 4 protein [Candidatus Omnitrophica bacterium]|jgi:glycosyltransferase involved in cell wall biosynthesis|nr:glycosyltransferase family 4 protein [Candidatus Omnitrophota bacterium]